MQKSGEPLTVLVGVISGQIQIEDRIDGLSVEMDRIRLKMTDADTELVSKPTWTPWQIVDTQNHVR